ncbi:hypothetical protein OF846_001024 [Rhodotorula toruloides]|nr:hypothetical protein OF846_001024 [Rhodotorula toruloides]
MASSRQGHAAFDPVHDAGSFQVVAPLPGVEVADELIFPAVSAAENEKARRAPQRTQQCLAAWGGPNALRRMIIAAVDEWQEAICDFRRGSSSYETAFLTYATQMPEHLHIQPGLNTKDDRIHLTLPALPIRVVLATDRYRRLQWAIAQRGVNNPAKIHEIAGPAVLKAQQAPPKDSSCAYPYNGNRPALLKDGLVVRLLSGTGRKDIHVRLQQHDAEEYQVSGVDTLSAVAPRTVVFNLTVEHAAVNPLPTLYLRLTFDLEYGQPGHAGARSSSTNAGHEVVARSLGVRTPRVLRRW